MTKLPSQARLLWLVAVVAGLIGTMLAVGSAALGSLEWPTAALLFLAGLIAQSFRVPFSYRRTHNSQTGTIASSFYVASFLLLPPAQAVLVNVASYLLSWPRRRYPWFKDLFNLAQYALAIGLAGLVWHVGGSGSGLVLSAEHTFWLLAALSIYFLVNTGLVSLMVALADRLPVGYVWLRSHRGILPAYLGMLCGGVLIANLWSNSPWSVLLAVIPLVAIYYGFRHAIDLEYQTLSAMFHLADILDQRDYYTHQHSVRVGEDAEKLALRLNTPAEEAYLIYLCGRLHDVGKCAVNNEVLLKPEKLSTEERAHMARHPLVGSEMLAHFGLFRVGARYVRGHHEFFDGSGYPDGLSGESIPLGARIIAVADAYDAMTTNRPYRNALPQAEAMRRLRAGRGTQWDPRVVDAYLGMLAERREDPAPVSDEPRGAAAVVTRAS